MSQQVEKPSTKMLSTKDMIHIGSEVVVIAGVAYYLSNKTSALDTKVKELEDVVKRQDVVINQLSQVVQNLSSGVQNLSSAMSQKRSSGNARKSRPRRTQVHRQPPSPATIQEESDEVDTDEEIRSELEQLN